MWNAPIKFLLATAVAATMFVGCKSDPEAQGRPLLEAAQAEVEAGRFDRALALIDSLNKSVPQAYKAREEGLHVEMLAKEGIAVKNLALADSQLVVSAIVRDSLAGMMTRVANPVEPYFIVRGTSLPPRGGLQARVSPEGVFYIVATLADAKPVRAAIALSAPDGRSATTADLRPDHDRNIVSGGVRLLHFVGMECDSLGHFAAETAGPLRVEFHGSSTKSRPLTAQERTSIATAWLYCRALQDNELAGINRQKAEALLQTIRQLAARTLPDSTTTSK